MKEMKEKHQSILLIKYRLTVKHRILNCSKSCRVLMQLADNIVPIMTGTEKKTAVIGAFFILYPHEHGVYNVSQDIEYFVKRYRNNGLPYYDFDKLDVTCNCTIL